MYNIFVTLYIILSAVIYPDELSSARESLLISLNKFPLQAGNVLDNIGVIGRGVQYVASNPEFLTWIAARFDLYFDKYL